MKRKKLIMKGRQGYINQRKIIHLLWTLLCMSMVMIFLYTGIFLYKSVESIFTVMAIVSVIPASKFAVSYLTLFRYHSTNGELALTLLSVVPEEWILWDLVISSTEKLFQVYAAVIRDDSVYLYCNVPKEQVLEKEKYIRKIITTESKVNKIRIFVDENKFLQQMEEIKARPAGKYDEKIKKVLCIYSL